MSTDWNVNCACCGEPAVIKVRAFRCPEMPFGWTLGVRQLGGGSTGFSHYCPVCSALPDLVERMRDKRRMEKESEVHLTPRAPEVE